MGRPHGRRPYSGYVLTWPRHTLVYVLTGPGHTGNAIPLDLKPVAVIANV